MPPRQLRRHLLAESLTRLRWPIVFSRRAFSADTSASHTDVVCQLGAALGCSLDKEERINCTLQLARKRSSWIQLLRLCTVGLGTKQRALARWIGPTALGLGGC